MLEHGCDDFDDVKKVLKSVAEGAKLIDEGHAAEKDRINTEFDKAKFMLNEEMKKLKGEIEGIKEELKYYINSDEEKMGSVKDRIDKWENRITIIEKAAAGSGEDRGDTGGGKLDIREIKEWTGPSSRDFYDYCWYFYIALDGAKQGLGRWAKWAANPEHLDKPISSRNGEPEDPYPGV